MEAARKLNPSPRPTQQKKRKLDNSAGTIEEIYNFKILLTNGTSVTVTIPKSGQQHMSIDHLVNAVKAEYKLTFRRPTDSPSLKFRRRDINWNSDELYLVDSEDNVIKTKIMFSDFDPRALNILRLHDGSATVTDIYENMWDITPDTDLLMELPEDYSFEAALAELIDNSLQAVWTNDSNERRLISVEVDATKIAVFDTGPGMDASEQHSIVKWGKMGASLHRSYKYQTTRGNIKPPYLLPFFGMFGYGGSVASMHLGRRAVVSSKRKDSKKVYTLNLEREALLSNSGSRGMWKTDGGMRDTLDIDIQKSPHGSFTKVEIYRVKMKSLIIAELRWRLKDIYFPYIQCDELSSTHGTTIPVEFEVNGLNLVEVQGGETAITNWFSCNGPDFVFQIRIQVKKEDGNAEKAGQRVTEEANARLKCVYFPFREGKEHIDMILEKLNSEEFRIKEDFTTFNRVSIRRLGRLLPDARWMWLPFMDLRQKKGDRAQILKRCCMRVKCFIDADGGFSPTRSKTDLVYHHAFTTALKNFGSKSPDKEMNIEIFQNGKKGSLSNLKNEYLDWICKMHDTYDDENECGEDQPVIVVNPNKKRLGVSSDVVRVHREIKKNGILWKSGQKIMILKGSCAGCHSNNVYATLELFVLGGLEGDSGGESRLLCRPINLRDEEGCVLDVKDGVASLDMRRALPVPLNVIDSGKCVALKTNEWNHQLSKLNEKAPQMIEMLSAQNCQELDIDGALPLVTVISAGQAAPQELVAVIRPKCFTPSVSKSNSLEQKYIINNGPEMSLEVKFLAVGEDSSCTQHVYSIRSCSSERQGLDGLYIFPLGSKMPNMFTKAGRYILSLYIKNSDIKSFEAKVDVAPSLIAKKWKLLSEFQYPWKLRMGLCHLGFDLACYDEYENRIPFSCMPKVDMSLILKRHVSSRVNLGKMNLSHDKLTVHFEDVTIKSNELDQIRPHYKANLFLSSPDAPFSETIPCQVTPGPFQTVEMIPTNFGDNLYPGCVIQQLELEFFDAYGNHAMGGSVAVVLDGFTFEDNIGSKREYSLHLTLSVDESVFLVMADGNLLQADSFAVGSSNIDEFGCLNLNGVLKVTARHGQTVSISLIYESEVLQKWVFQTKRRILKLASELPKHCYTGMQLLDVRFEVFNDEGHVDTTIHNEDPRLQSHMLLINIDASGCQFSQYSFEHGCCTVPEISLPLKEGLCIITATHSSYPDIYLHLKVQVIQALCLENQNFNCISPDGKLPLLVQATMDTVHAKEKELYEAVLVQGKDIGVIEEELTRLQIQKKEIEQEMLSLQELQSLDHFNSSLETKQLMDIIESKSESAASLVCNLLNRESLEEPLKSFMADVVGIVSQLGAVQSEQLSRVLAEYLGEDQMLAIVCRTADGAKTLRKCEDVNDAAAALGKSTLRRFDVICLEDIRPFTGGYVTYAPCDFQMTLDLKNPMLENGKPPEGFLGYAVNMVHLDIAQVHIKTRSGHGLRETLFYRLFGELQLYDTIDHMDQAFRCGCVNQNAVSIDGGIARGNGVFSYGFRNPDVCFPVFSLEDPHLSQDEQETLKKMFEKKMELVRYHNRIIWLTDIHQKASHAFDRTHAQYKKFLDKNALLLEYNVPGSSSTSG